jgi:TubC N-terminal docking domain
MTAMELLTDLHRQGFILIPLPEGKLAVKPVEKLTDELRETIRRYKTEVLALLSQRSVPSSASPSSGQIVVLPPYRTLYEETAEIVRDDCFLIDPLWLLDHYPELWQQLRGLDDELSELERKGADDLVYRGILECLVTCLRYARILYEKDCGLGSERATC